MQTNEPEHDILSPAREEGPFQDGTPPDALAAPEGEPTSFPAVPRGMASSLGAGVALVWVFVFVSFHMIRFLAVVWGAGDKGLFGM